MSLQRRTPALSVLATMGLIVAFVMAVLSCSSSGSSAGGSSGCTVNDTIEKVPPGQLPKCAANEADNSSFVYSCAATHGTFFIVYRRSAQLFGKPGGVWHSTATTTAFATITRRLGC